MAFDYRSPSPVQICTLTSSRSHSKKNIMYNQLENLLTNLINMFQVFQVIHFWKIDVERDMNRDLIHWYLWSDRRFHLIEFYVLTRDHNWVWYSWDQESSTVILWTDNWYDSMIENIWSSACPLNHIRISGQSKLRVGCFHDQNLQFVISDAQTFISWYKNFDKSNVRNT